MLHMLTAVCAGLCAWSASPAPPENTLPYAAYVAEEHADVQSGPGRQYYPTHRLTRGDRVEVYREDPGGWLAIRPPEGSFSWALADQLRMTGEPGVAEVTGDQAAAWVGAEVDSVADHKWQVRLKPGELVEVLGQRVLAIHSRAALKRWCMIAPPAGEFRWVPADQVSRQPPREPDRDGDGPHVRLADYQIVVSPQPPAEGKSSGSFVAKRDRSDATPASSTDASPPGRSSQPKTRHPEELQDALDELNVKLSLIAAQNPAYWALAPVQAAAQDLVDAAQTTADRSLAQNMLESIREFDDFHKRFQQWEQRRTTGGAPVDSSPTKPNEADDGPRTTAAAALADPRFDGSGWLMPVHSTKRAAPPFALANDDGIVLYYVTPAPGLNLHRYTRKEIGVIGQRSYIPALQTPHLSAHRVVLLDRRR